MNIKKIAQGAALGFLVWVFVAIAVYSVVSSVILITETFIKG